MIFDKCYLYQKSAFYLQEQPRNSHFPHERYGQTHKVSNRVASLLKIFNKPIGFKYIKSFKYLNVLLAI